MSDFKVGDRVRIKSYDKMIKEYLIEKDGESITLPVSRFDKDMKHLCGREATIASIYGEGMRVKLVDWNDKSGSLAWSYSIYMIEKVQDVEFEEYCQNDIEMLMKACGSMGGEKMNKVLELWYKRQRDKIHTKYVELEEKFTNDKYSVVQSYKDLIEQFNKDLDALYDFDKATEQYVIKLSPFNNSFKYDIDYDKIKSDFRNVYLVEKENEIKELNNVKEEVEAQLSLSDDLSYQQEVLERYKIINKKTKKISE